jgi:hydrogenase-4 component F
MSEFLILSSAFARAPALAILAVFGLLLAFGALFLRLNTIAFGEPTGEWTPVRASYLPIFAHLALVLVAGLYLPAAMVTWFQNVAALLN